MADSITQFKASSFQDSAAGGVKYRKIKIKSGDIVTVSLSTSSTKSPYRVILRFKSAFTIQRDVGIFEAKSSIDAIRMAWQEIRKLKIIELEGWSWVNPKS